jgi:transposase
VVAEIRTAGISGFSAQRQHDAASEEKTKARRPRRNHSPAFKAKVAVATIRGEKTLIELTQDFDVAPNQIKQWRGQLLEGATGVFGDSLKTEPEPEPVIDVKTLHAKTGELTPETDFLSGALGKAGLLPSASG